MRHACSSLCGEGRLPQERSGQREPLPPTHTYPLNTNLTALLLPRRPAKPPRADGSLRPEFRDDCPEPYRRLAERCWHPDPEYVGGTALLPPPPPLLTAVHAHACAVNALQGCAPLSPPTPAAPASPSPRRRRPSFEEIDRELVRIEMEFRLHRHRANSKRASSAQSAGTGGSLPPSRPGSPDVVRPGSRAAAVC